MRFLGGHRLALGIVIVLAFTLPSVNAATGRAGAPGTAGVGPDTDASGKNKVQCGVNVGDNWVTRDYYDPQRVYAYGPFHLNCRADAMFWVSEPPTVDIHGDARIHYCSSPINENPGQVILCDGPIGWYLTENSYPSCTAASTCAVIGRATWSSTTVGASDADGTTEKVCDNTPPELPPPATGPLGPIWLAVCGDQALSDTWQFSWARSVSSDCPSLCAAAGELWIMGQVIVSMEVDKYWTLKPSEPRCDDASDSHGAVFECHGCWARDPTDTATESLLCRAVVRRTVDPAFANPDPVPEPAAPSDPLGLVCERELGGRPDCGISIG